MKKLALILVTLLYVPVSFSNTHHYEKHAQELETRGVTIVPNVFTKAEIEAFRSELNPIVKTVEDTMKTQGKPRYFHNDGKQTTSYYWHLGSDVILQAGPGRFDTRYGINKGKFADKNFQHNPVIEKIIEQKLHHRFTNHTGVVYAAPGSGDQYWHRDTDNIADSDADGSKLVKMDDFYFTVLIPLVDMNKENGTTEFMLTTHRKTFPEFKDAEMAQFDVKAGDVIIFNGKINHRGKGNLSQNPRPVLYNVYYKRWYNDSYREGVS